MNILLTTHSYLPQTSGVATVVHQIARHLVLSGHTVTVATGEAGFGPMVARGHGQSAKDSFDGVNVRRFRVMGNAVAGIRGDAGEYREFVCQRHWDIVVMHCLQTWSTDVLLPVLESLAAPVLVTHGLSAWDDPEYGAYFRELATRLRALAAVVTISAANEEGRWLRGAANIQWSVIPNGVDLAEFDSVPQAERTMARAERPLILNVSNHNSAKGHDRYFSLGAALSDHPDRPALVIAGMPHGASLLRAGRIGIKGGCWYRCRLRAARSPVVLASGISRREIVDLYQQASIFALTSRWEAYPLVILEALAARTPWISLDVGNLRKEVPGGLVVESLADLIAAAQRLLRDRGLRAELADRGYEFVQSHDWRSVAAQHEDLYLSLI
jgi:glycosyltransferase involved in cell wall biosynthesis